MADDRAWWQSRVSSRDGNVKSSDVSRLRCRPNPAFFKEKHEFEGVEVCEKKNVGSSQVFFKIFKSWLVLAFDNRPFYYGVLDNAEMSVFLQFSSQLLKLGSPNLS